MIRSGYQWYLELGSKLVGRELVCVEKPDWLTVLAIGGVYEVEEVNGLRVAGSLVSGFSLTKFTLKGNVMVDWNRPLEMSALSTKKVVLVGTAKNGNKLVESYNGAIYRAEPETGRVVNSGPERYITNVVEPWEEAFKQYCLEEVDKTEEEIFRRGFEFGRDCK